MMLTQDRRIIVGDAPTDRNHEFLFKDAGPLLRAPGGRPGLSGQVLPGEGGMSLWLGWAKKPLCWQTWRRFHFPGTSLPRDFQGA